MSGHRAPATLEAAGIPVLRGLWALFLVASGRLNEWAAWPEESDTADRCERELRQRPRTSLGRWE